MTNFIQRSFSDNNLSHVSALDEFSFWSAPFGISLLNCIRMKKNTRILDIGYGTGFPLIELADRFGEASEVFGVDIWEEAAERTKQKIQARGLKNITALVHHAEDLPFQKDFFDLVVSNNGLNNVQDLPQVLSEIHRVLKNDGQLVFTVNLPETMQEFYSAYESVLKNRGLRSEILKMKQHIYEKRKPLDEIRSLLPQAGFKIEREIQDQFHYRFPDATAMFNYYFIREFFLPSWTALLEPSQIQDVFSEIEARLNAVADEQGELRLTIPFVCMDSSKLL